MAKLVLEGIVTPVGAVTPDYLGQHYIDTTPASEVAYVAKGLTNADWQEIGAGGGGGGGFGLIASQEVTKLLADDAGTLNWLMDTEGPMSLKLVGLSTYKLTLDLSAVLTAGNTVQNRLAIMIGQTSGAAAIALTIDVVAGAGGNIFGIVVMDEAGTGSSGAKTFTLQNQILYLDLFTILNEPDGNGTSGPTVFVSKSGQFGTTVGEAG